jgi:hypothetical protein
MPPILEADEAATRSGPVESSPTLSEIDAAPSQQALVEGRLDELCITTGIVRPIPRPPLVDRESRLIWPYIIAITFFH